MADISQIEKKKHRVLTGNRTRDSVVKVASVTFIPQCLTYDSSTNSSFIKSICHFTKDLKVTNLDKQFLLFFLVSYETLGLCGHPVIEKMQKLFFLTNFFSTFWWTKIGDLGHTATVGGCSCDLRRVYKLGASVRGKKLEVWRFLAMRGIWR